MFGPSQQDLDDLRRENRESDSEREFRLEHEERLRQEEEEREEEDRLRNSPYHCPSCFGYRWIEANQDEPEDEMCGCNPRCDYEDENDD